MSLPIVWGMALADVRDRIRRPAYAVTLLAAVLLGYIAAPAADGRWVAMYIGQYRGEYNSAYIGTVIALAAALWLTLGGFYVVRGTIARDARSGVGELLAATEMRSGSYVLAKFVGNLTVLGSMLGVLALTAAVLQLARGESYALNPYELLLPFVLLALPVAAFTAAAALLFDSVPLLQAGLGNVVWFFFWMVLAIGGQSASAPLGGLGVNAVARSMSAAMAARDLHVTAGDFSLGLVYLDRPLRTFPWDGLSLSAGLLADRLGLALVAVGLALLPALWFHRFDPARGRFGTRRAARPEQPVPVPVGSYTPPGGAAGPPVVPGGGRVVTVATLRASTPGRSTAAGRLVTGELRILVQAVSLWWWLGFAVLAVVGLVAPTRAVTTLALPAAWIWPVLIWSRLGVQQYENGVDALLGAYPHPVRRLLAEWCAGVLFTAAAGLTPLLRIVVAGDGAGVIAWAVGAAFIPSLALALGQLTRTQRFFQVVYLALWYGVANGFHSIDYMGSTRVAGDPLPPSIVLYAAVAAGLVALTVAVNSSRRALAR